MKKYLLLFVFVFSAICGYSQTNIDSGLVVCLPFSGNADDYSGNGHNGVVNGAVLTADRFGNSNSAYDFDGVDDYVNIGQYSNMITKQEVSFSFWSKAGDYGNNTVIMLVPDDDDRIVCSVNYAPVSDPANVYWDYGNIFNGGRISTSTGSLSTNWEHYVFMISKNSGIKQVWKNGVQIINTTFGDSLLDFNRDFYIGANDDRNGGNLNFEGKIDDFRIYDRLLSSTEIQKLYSDNTVSCTPSNVNELALSDRFSIYPNPASENINIETKGISVKKISILNLYGQIIFEGTDLQKNGIYNQDISSLSKGTYLIKFITNDNREAIKRFVVM